ncbi:MAG: hypothetical protein NT039_02410 [Candidatus Berkelbacteria bacterium]|nr:hypothetical protein [Candidatus Berkelbacteria bacterium]
MAKKTFNLLCLPSFENIEQMLDRFSFPIKLTKGGFKDLEFIFQDKGVKVLHQGIDLASFSFVWLVFSWKSRDLAYAIKLYLDHSNVHSTYVEKSTSKRSDNMIFALGGIETPNMLFLSRIDIKKSLAKIGKICGYPLIIKDIKGTKGVHSKFITTERELVEKMRKLPRHKRYLFQKYIPNRYDWGVLVVNGTVVAGAKRYHCQGEFRNNVCNGAKEVFVDLEKIPVRIKKMAIKASKLLGLSWSRADIIIDKDTKKPYLLEVNRSPRITSKSSEVEGAYDFLSSQINPAPFVRKRCGVNHFPAREA